MSTPVIIIIALAVAILLAVLIPTLRQRRARITTIETRRIDPKISENDHA